MKLKPLSPDDVRITDPLFTFREAARFLDVKVSTLHHWAHPEEGFSPLVTTLPDTSSSLPFIGFAEAFVVKAALNAKVPHHRIRPGVEAIRKEAGNISHALASRLVWTDGAEILWGAVGEDLMVARTKQGQFREAVKDQLRLITYGDDGFALYLRLPQYKRATVTVNPYVAGGSPIIRSGIGIRVQDVQDRVDAGDSPEEVARSFRIPLKAVKEVVGRSARSTARLP